MRNLNSLNEDLIYLGRRLQTKKKKKKQTLKNKIILRTHRSRELKITHV